MAGKTDFQIVQEALDLHALPSENGVMEKVEQRYIDFLRIEIRNSEKHIKPGVLDTLNWLHEQVGCTIGLLTGNIESGARIKLGAFGILDFFKVGAFGSDHSDRKELLPIAIRKLAKSDGMELSYQDCVVIGDTPRDVDCSKPYGAKCVAVATGPYDYDVLSSTDADIVVNTLEGVQEYLCSL